MDGIGIVILFIVIGIISMIASAARKRTGSSRDGQPPRRTMSDIQRAFMMMSGLEDNEERQPGGPAAPRQGYVPPATQQGGYAPPPPQQREYVPPAPRPAYKPPEAFGEDASGYGSSLSREGLSSGFAASGSLGKTAIEIERESAYTAATESIRETEESLGENELSILRESDGFGEDLSADTTGVRHAARPALRLFANKNDFVRAVIYSEIMGSGPLAKRSAK